MRARTALACAAACSVALAACGGAKSGSEPQPATFTPDESVAATAYDFYDPCNETTTAWFSDQGYVHPTYIEPQLDQSGSSCSYEGISNNGYAVLSRSSIPGDRVDIRIHQLLGVSGPVYDANIDGYPVKMEVLTAGRARQDCHLVITVDYGFLEVTGGPLRHLAPSYPRDCDAVRDFAGVLLGRMEATWDPPSGD